MRRVEINDININNYYVCEAHFPNQILDYATRKILIKTAKPLTCAELEALPSHNRYVNIRPKHSYDDDDQDYDEDDYEDSKGEHAQYRYNRLAAAPESCATKLIIIIFNFCLMLLSGISNEKNL